MNQLLLRGLMAGYRRLPMFRGKYRIGYRCFRSLLDRPEPMDVRLDSRLRFFLPNTIENIGKEIAVNGCYEHGTVIALRRFLGGRERPVFFDVGANIGAISLPLKLRLPETVVHAFEASPATFGYLQKNCRSNKIPGITAVNKLVHSEAGRELLFYDSAHYYGKSSLAPVYTQSAVPVQSITLDDYCRCNGIKGIDLVKVDVQGYEVEVFRGMHRMLREKRVEALYFEFEDWAEEAAGFAPGASQSFLLQTGYRLFTSKGKPVAEPLRSGSMMLWAKPG